MKPNQPSQYRVDGDAETISPEELKALEAFQKEWEGKLASMKEQREQSRRRWDALSSKAEKQIKDLDRHSRQIRRQSWAGGTRSRQLIAR